MSDQDRLEDIAETITELHHSEEGFDDLRYACERLARSEAEVTRFTQEHERLKADYLRVVDAAEMLWTVLANVSDGDWEKQTPEWQEYAARWRDNYIESLKPGWPGSHRLAAQSA